MARTKRYKELKAAIMAEKDPVAQLVLLDGASLALKKWYAHNCIKTEAASSLVRKRLDKLRAHNNMLARERDEQAGRANYLWRSYVPPHSKYLEHAQHNLNIPCSEEEKVICVGAAKTHIRAALESFSFVVDAVATHNSTIEEIIYVLTRYSRATGNMQPIDTAELCAMLDIKTPLGETLTKLLNDKLAEFTSILGGDITKQVSEMVAAAKAVAAQ